MMDFFKKFLINSVAALTIIMFCSGPALADIGTIYTFKTREIVGLGTIFTAKKFHVINPQWTNWMQVDKLKTVCFDFDLTDADSSITSIDLACFTADYAKYNAGVATGAQLTVYTSTSAAGVTTSVPSTIRHTSTTGGAPGTSNWNTCVTNIPNEWMWCSVTANGAPDVNDSMNLQATGITP